MGLYRVDGISGISLNVQVPLTMQANINGSERSAKPLCAGSIPARTSNPRLRRHRYDCGAVCEITTVAQLGFHRAARKFNPGFAEVRA